MQYALEIRKNNVACHLDLERDIQYKKNGLFTFTIRINAGNVVDYNITQHVSAATYLGFKGITYEKLSITFDPRVGSEIDPVRDNHNDSPA